MKKYVFVCVLDYLHVVSELPFTTLREWLVERNETNGAEIDRLKMYVWFNEICKGIMYLQKGSKHDLSHGNLKPENILMTKDDEIKLSNMTFLSTIAFFTEVDIILYSPETVIILIVFFVFIFSYTLQKLKFNSVH